MKFQLVLLVALFACVYSSPLPQAVEEVKAAEPAGDVPAAAVAEVSIPEDAPAAEEKAAPVTTEAEAEQPTESPTTIEPSNDSASEAKAEPEESNKVDEAPAVPEVQAGLADDAKVEAAIVPAAEVVAETAQITADVKQDTVQLADVIEPAAVASDETNRAVRTADDEVEKKEEDAPTTTEAAEVVTEAIGEDKPAEQPQVRSAPAEESSEPAAVTDAVEPKTEATTTPAATNAGSAASAVTTQPKSDSSEESKESQESEEEKS